MEQQINSSSHSQNLQSVKEPLFVSQSYIQPQKNQKTYQSMQDQDLVQYQDQTKPQYQPNQQDQYQPLDSYIISKTLGKGNFGKVKLAMHKITQQYVAVKILQKDLIFENTDIVRITRQLKIMKKLRHPFVVQLYQIIETAKQLYLIMEYAEGGDLFEKIVNQERIKQTQAARIYTQIVLGMDYFHSKGVTHRDLKPQNILMSKDGTIKIADFGLGNMFKPEQKLKTACGSPCYASPQMLNREPYDPKKIDIWSSGIILYAMVCGYLPFEDQVTAKLYEKIKTSNVKLPSWVSSPCRNLIRGLLTKDPKLRYDVESILSHEMIKPHLQELKQIIRQKQLTENKIEEICEMYDIEENEKLVSDLNKNRHNNLTTLYYLAVRRIQKMEKEQLEQDRKIREGTMKQQSYMVQKPIEINEPQQNNITEMQNEIVLDPVQENKVKNITDLMDQQKYRAIGEKQSKEEQIQKDQKSQTQNHRIIDQNHRVKDQNYCMKDQLEQNQRQEFKERQQDRDIRISENQNIELNQKDFKSQQAEITQQQKKVDQNQQLVDIEQKLKAQNIKQNAQESMQIERQEQQQDLCQQQQGVGLEQRMLSDEQLQVHRLHQQIGYQLKKIELKEHQFIQDEDQFKKQDFKNQETNINEQKGDFDKQQSEMDKQLQGIEKQQGDMGRQREQTVIVKQCQQKQKENNKTCQQVSDNLNENKIKTFQYENKQIQTQIGSTEVQNKSTQLQQKLIESQIRIIEQQNTSIEPTPDSIIEQSYLLSKQIQQTLKQLNQMQQLNQINQQSNIQTTHTQNNTMVGIQKDNIVDIQKDNIVDVQKDSMIGMQKDSMIDIQSNTIVEMQRKQKRTQQQHQQNLAQNEQNTKIQNTLTNQTKHTPCQQSFISQQKGKLRNELHKIPQNHLISINQNINLPCYQQGQSLPHKQQLQNNLQTQKLTEAHFHTNHLQSHLSLNSNQLQSSNLSINTIINNQIHPTEIQPFYQPQSNQSNQIHSNQLSQIKQDKPQLYIQNSILKNHSNTINQQNIFNQQKTIQTQQISQQPIQNFNSYQQLTNNLQKIPCQNLLKQTQSEKITPNSNTQIFTPIPQTQIHQTQIKSILQITPQQSLQSPSNSHQYHYDLQQAQLIQQIQNIQQQIQNIQHPIPKKKSQILKTGSYPQNKNNTLPSKPQNKFLRQNHKKNHLFSTDQVLPNKQKHQTNTDNLRKHQNKNLQTSTKNDVKNILVARNIRLNQRSHSKDTPIIFKSNKNKLLLKPQIQKQENKKSLSKQKTLRVVNKTARPRKSQQKEKKLNKQPFIQKFVIAKDKKPDNKRQLTSKEQNQNQNFRTSRPNKKLKNEQEFQQEQKIIKTFGITQIKQQPEIISNKVEKKSRLKSTSLISESSKKFSGYGIKFKKNDTIEESKEQNIPISPISVIKTKEVSKTFNTVKLTFQNQHKTLISNLKQLEEQNSLAFSQIDKEKKEIKKIQISKPHTFYENVKAKSFSQYSNLNSNVSKGSSSKVQIPKHIQNSQNQTKLNKTIGSFSYRNKQSGRKNETQIQLQRQRTFNNFGLESTNKFGNQFQLSELNKRQADEGQFNFSIKFSVVEPQLINPKLIMFVSVRELYHLIETISHSKNINFSNIIGTLSVYQYPTKDYMYVLNSNLFKSQQTLSNLKTSSLNSKTVDSSLKKKKKLGTFEFVELINSIILSS